MVSEVIRKKVYDAATQGDLTKFQEVVEDDPYLLDVVSFAGSRTILHIATLWGQAGIVEVVLKINPRLARSLDSEKKSALHLAAEEGAVEIALKLVSVAPAMCWLRDCHGMNPIHIAAMNGHAEVLEELIRQDPLPAREKVDRGQTVMHLCVKHGQLMALKVLENRLGELMFLEDDDGETLLHLVVRYKQVEIARYLTEKYTIQGQRVNSKGETAMEISRGSRGVDATYYSEIRKVLIQQAKLYDGIDLFRTANHVVIVLVIMIAEMAFQSMISPPGGVWQDDSSTHKAGKAILASNDPKIYEDFVASNTMALTSSLLTILLFLFAPNSSLNSYSQLTAWFGLVLSLITFYESYTISVEAITPSPNTEPFHNLHSIVWWPAIITYLGMLVCSPYMYYTVPRISPLMQRIRVACGGMVVIRNYCVGALLKLSSLIDKYVWRFDADSTP